MNRPIARAIHANRGVEALYRNRMTLLVNEMSTSVDHWVESTYRAAPPVMAQDASPVSAMRKQIRELAKLWLKRFNDAAPKLAEAYVKESFKATDSAFRLALKDAGWAVEFKMTPAMREAFSASLAENVGLIRSIPEQYLLQVQGSVMRSYTRGRDLQSLVQTLRALYPPAANRAALIARDQSNKANSVVTQARQIELGIEEAIWMHSHAGKTPRPDHVAANGRRYKVKEGCLISGEYIFPGEEINCRCTSRSVLPFSFA